LRVETIPLILGILVALVGIGLLADAWLPEQVSFRRERRRSVREERHQGGEAAIAVGVLCMAAALIGRDTWLYGNVAMIVGAIMILIGGVLNRRYFRDRIVNRGALRRGTGPGPKRPEKNDRIR
jgi:hypothetical protein